MDKTKGSTVAKTRTELSQTSARMDASEPDHEQARAILAYRFWQERGCPIGSPEEDWFRAEQALKSAAVVPAHRQDASRRHTQATRPFSPGQEASA